MGKLDELRAAVTQYGTAPSFAEMPRKTLEDKGIAGPTAAHTIEEIHSPFNFAFLTVTTGTQAFQNIVGVTAPELPGRIAAGRRALEMAGLAPGDHLLVCYPPLVNVFPAEALRQSGLRWSFLAASRRDALLLALCEERPKAVLGESAFLRAALQDAAKMELLELMPRGTVFIAAGTPMDAELPEVARESVGGTVHDLYGCQEFGWLAMDGLPLREDISLLPAEKEGLYHYVAGGLPIGDAFPMNDAEGAGHGGSPEGRIATSRRQRPPCELVTTVHASTAAGLDTVQRLARGILRIKGRIVRLAPDISLAAPATVLSVAPFGQSDGPRITGPRKTEMFDALLKAQLDYQAQGKRDPAWLKNT